MNPFAAIAMGYAKHRPPVHGQILRRALADWPTAIRCAVDVGCGSGISTLALAEFAQARIGVEPAEPMVEAARAVDPTVRFLVGPAEAIPLPNGTADLITAAGALNYADLSRFFPEAHRVLGEGGVIGPDLTNTSRADTAWLLTSIVDPSAVVRTQYVQYAIRTSDEVLRTGVIGEQDGASITLIDAKGERARVSRDRIESLRELSTSLMPEKLLDALAPQERRDLVRYLQQPGK